MVGGYSIITTVCIGRISHEPGQARSPDIVRQEVEVRAQEARRESPGLGGQAGKSWPRKPGGKVLAEEAGRKVLAQAGKSWTRRPGRKVLAQEARRESPGLGGQAGKSRPRKPGGKVLAQEARQEVLASGSQAGKPGPRKPGREP